jgi:LuxR family maltose regulon positive regulatory protein
VARSLLVTKLNIPQLRPELIPRPRLIEKLNRGLKGRLTLVSAPAGFGKTTLITDWLNQLLSLSHGYRAEHCTWLSLDQHDNEPVRFFQYFIGAIQVVYPDLGVDLVETLDNSPKPNIQTIIKELLNEVTIQDQPLLMVLDDYHEINNDSIHQILQTTIDFLPPQVHIVITTRKEPPLSLPRWRVRGWLSDITATDLRFDQVETGDFLHHTMQLDISSEAVALLDDRTEGWVAGLQLAAISLADTDFSIEAIQQFGGRDRYVADYLLMEVLDNQPKEIQEFLIQTAILDRINANLCTAILHAEIPRNGLNLNTKFQNILNTLERANLFIIPLDREGYWYRYHHLFSQLLHQHLEQTWIPEEIHRLYRRAAHWFADRELLEEAINYSLQGEDYAFTARLISGIEVDSLWNQTWGLKLGKWGAAIPTETLQEFPKATIHIALAHMTRNEIKEAVHYVNLVREDPQVEAEILLIDSIFIRNKGDIPQALDLATKAALLYKQKDPGWYIATQTQVVVCLWMLGEVRNAEKLTAALKQDIQTSSGKFLNVYIQVFHLLGMIKEMRGQLVEAERIYLEGIKNIEQMDITMPLIGLLQVRLAAIYYQWNDIDKARDYCETGLAWGERTGISDITTFGLFVQADLAIHQKDEKATRATLDQMSKLVDWAEFGDFDSAIRANQALYNLRLGYLDLAVRWADSSGLSLEDHPSLQYRAEYQSLVRIRFEEIHHLGVKGQAPKIIILVDKLIEMSIAHDYVDLMIYFWSIKALLLDFHDQAKHAIAALHEALSLAFPGGFTRIFIDFGSPMRDLLQKSLADEQHMVFKRRLLLTFMDEGITPQISVSSSHEIPVALTPREFEILQLIAAGLSNKAIQEKLILSKNTVRTHIKNLYSKLGVHSRTQAVQQARENGLI